MAEQIALELYIAGRLTKAQYEQITEALQAGSYQLEVALAQERAQLLGPQPLQPLHYSTQKEAQVAQNLFDMKKGSGRYDKRIVAGRASFVPLYDPFAKFRQDKEPLTGGSWDYERKVGGAEPLDDPTFDPEPTQHRIHHPPLNDANYQVPFQFEKKGGFITKLMRYSGI